MCGDHQFSSASSAWKNALNDWRKRIIEPFNDPAWRPRGRVMRVVGCTWSTTTATPRVKVAWAKWRSSSAWATGEFDMSTTITSGCWRVIRKWFRMSWVLACAYVEFEKARRGRQGGANARSPDGFLWPPIDRRDPVVEPLLETVEPHVGRHIAPEQQ